MLSGRSCQLSTLIVRITWSVMLGTIGLVVWFVGPIAVSRADRYIERTEAQLTTAFERPVKNGTMLVLRFRIDRPDGTSVLADWPADRDFASRLTLGQRMPVLYRALPPVSVTPDHPDLAGRSLATWRSIGLLLLGMAGAMLLFTLFGWLRPR
ncbi:hypothetical protein [Roseomonas sp. USHLN139]|uniref:hypothetical protein n=1 Tax=Roseomonas sp. USHLN139 TaxID=3081298 RepID=UPI003B014AFD